MESNLVIEERKFVQFEFKQTLYKREKEVPFNNDECAGTKPLVL